MKKFYGKYRGTVASNIDETGRGRIQVKVPLVLGEGTQSWAMPCVPYAGPGVGFFAIPPREANVWVEFEGGDPGKPIWSGCFWGLLGAPAPAPFLAETKVIKTDTATITLNDLPGAGGISIEMNNGMKITMTATGLEITNGQASIQLQATNVNINNGALEVT